jgi:hypothetical protein
MLHFDRFNLIRRGFMKEKDEAMKIGEKARNYMNQGYN